MQFNKGQRLTAGKLNELASEAGQGIDSETGFTAGKSYNKTYAVEQQNLRYAEDLYRIKKARSTIHFTGEDKNDPKYNMHYYVQIDTLENIPIAVGATRNFTRMEWVTDHWIYSAYATLYNTGDTENPSLHVCVMDDRWLARNDEWPDNFYEKWNPNSVADVKNYFSGLVELPICPGDTVEKDISIWYFQAFDQDNKLLFNFFTFTDLYSGVIFDNLQTIKNKFNDAIYNGNIDKIKVIGSILLTRAVVPHFSPSDPKVLNAYAAQRNCGALSLRGEYVEPWYINYSLGRVGLPLVQVGTQKIICDHYLEAKEDAAQLQLLSTEIAQTLPTLSGYTDVVIDCVNLSAYYTNYNRSNLSTYTEENDKYFKPEYMVRMSIMNAGQDLLNISYYNRYPICPTWEVYSR